MTFKIAGSPFQLIFILIVSVAALAAALIAEFGFHIAPCVLCLAQRVPFALAILVAAAGLVEPRARKIIFLALMLLFLSNTGIASYHIGVEQHWWGLDDAGNSQVCTASNLSAQNVQDLYKSMTGTALGDCAHPAFSFHGITFAVMNAVLSLFLMLLSARQIFIPKN